jgi:hypothetical protein
VSAVARQPSSPFRRNCSLGAVLPVTLTRRAGRLPREINLLSSLAHENIVSVLDVMHSAMYYQVTPLTHALIRAFSVSVSLCLSVCLSLSLSVSLSLPLFLSLFVRGCVPCSLLSVGRLCAQMVMSVHGPGLDLFEFIDVFPDIDEALAAFIFRQVSHTLFVA